MIAQVNPRSSRWHGKHCRYRFHFSEDLSLSVEWEGSAPPRKAKGFWRKYANHRSDFLRRSLPKGQAATIISPSGLFEIVGMAGGNN